MLNGRERCSLKVKEEVLSMKEEVLASSEKKLSLRGNDNTNAIPASIITNEGVQVDISSLSMMSNSTNNNHMKRDVRKQQVKIKELIEQNTHCKKEIVHLRSEMMNHAKELDSTNVILDSATSLNDKHEKR